MLCHTPTTTTRIANHGHHKGPIGEPRSFTPDLRFGELFCGAGGLSLGLKWAGFTPKWAIDCDVDACATYRQAIGAHCIYSKVEDVDFRSLPSVCGLAFGFPCNDFSMIGKRKGTAGYYGSLWKEAKRALDEVRPLWFIAENVPGLMSKGGGDIMKEFADAGDGYTVSVNLLKFEDYGVPQKRHRIIAVGIQSKHKGTFSPPVPTHSQPVTAREALRYIPPHAANHEFSRHSTKVIELLKSISPGGNCWHPAVPSHLRSDKRKLRLSTSYRRLHPDRPSFTVLASGGGGEQLHHFAEPRALTNRERARLQAFPDDFRFVGNRQSVRRQIGMSVPPLAAQQIGEALRKSLGST